MPEAPRGTQFRRKLAGVIIDAHIHQWDPFTTPRVVSGPAKLLRRAPVLRPLLMRLFPRAAREFAGDPKYLLNTYLPSDYAADAAPVEVGEVVHIEAAWQGNSVGETRWVSSLPFGQDGAPKLGAIVVHGDPAEPEVAEVLDAHRAASPLVRGVRFEAAHSPDQGIMDFAKRPNTLSEPAFLRGFSAIAERNLSFEIWVYSHELPSAVKLATEYPNTTFVLDHYATPIGALAPTGRHTGATAAERKGILDRWRDDISELAALNNVVAKHSGLGMPVLGLGRLPREQFRDTVAPLVMHLQEAFGPQRTFWSSNFPIDKPNIALPDSIWALREILGDRFDENAMLRDNARRVYNFPLR
ncbi:MAG TPA: amidohydrolase family protein [Mycobacterium sp.]|nr:amidohydrolase family protein [Mycobacterium sp.]